MVVRVLIEAAVSALDVLVMNGVHVVFELGNGEGGAFRCGTIHKVQLSISVGHLNNSPDSAIIEGVLGLERATQHIGVEVDHLIDAGGRARNFNNGIGGVAAEVGGDVNARLANFLEVGGVETSSG